MINDIREHFFLVVGVILIYFWRGSGELTLN